MHKPSLTGEEITIRAAEPEDAQAVRSLRLEALAVHPDAFSADLAITAAEDAGVWAERIAGYASNSSGAIYIALAGEILIGMAGIGRGRWPKRHHFATLWGVYVNQDWRGKHVCARMLDGCISWAQKNAISLINLGVNINNIAAIRAYSSKGFTIYGIEPRAIFYNGIYYDELLMARLL